MRDYATLTIFRTSGELDPHDVTVRLGVAPDAFRPAPGAYWQITTEERIESESMRVHVAHLLARLDGLEDELAALRSDGCWISVVYHRYGTTIDREEQAIVDADLETRDITFDVELER